ncbi:MAG: hypothetical protein DRJ03_15820 [Chloroflexi bacterium]|nr:MAG: hypothetical protein DRI81_00195 [Chloroflexota bacterium]RLC83887.1 MAG: hypothetical protein DRJ03_15820 [Chloroflexota bacterium]
MSKRASDPTAILARYVNGPTELEAAIVGFTEAELDTALDDESWTIRQIVHHVVDGDDIWKICVKIALGNSEATFSLQWYWDLPQTRWAESWAYAERPLEPSLALFAANRRHVEQLVQAIPGAWEREIMVEWPHQEKERVTVGWVIEMQASHVMGHVEDIQNIWQARKL